MSGDAGLEAGIGALARLDLAGLRTVWLRRFGTACSLRSRDLVRRILAFELQADAYGGIDPEVKRRIRRTSLKVARRKPGLQPGTRLVRDWRGSRHEIDVVDGGFAHEGTTYASLSEVARAITGTRWSGPRFFGLAEGLPS